MLRNYWKWKVTAYYSDDVKPPKKPGGLALQTVHKDDLSKDMEVRIFKARKDIGVVNIERIND